MKAAESNPELKKKIKIKFSLPPDAILMKIDKLQLKQIKKIWEKNEDGLDLS